MLTAVREAYPLVHHIADKVAAIYERHGEDRGPSTRYRDLVDLVAIITSASVSAETRSAVLLSEFERRGLTLPHKFDVPDRTLWEQGYSAEARRSLLNTARTVEEALAAVGAFVDPVTRRHRGRSLGPDSGEWIES